MRKLVRETEWERVYAGWRRHPTFGVCDPEDFW